LRTSANCKRDDGDANSGRDANEDGDDEDWHQSQLAILGNCIQPLAMLEGGGKENEKELNKLDNNELDKNLGRVWSDAFIHFSKSR